VGNWSLWGEDGGFSLHAAAAAIREKLVGYPEKVVEGNSILTTSLGDFNVKYIAKYCFILRG
jgi:hypothetical protein